MVNKGFKNIEELKYKINQIEVSYIQLYDRIMVNYPGMIERYELESENYGRNISLAQIFECRGLDWSGHAIYKELKYKFNSIEEIIHYLMKRYNITIQDMDGNFPENMPSQIESTPEEEKIYQKNWDKFVSDFKNGIFIEKSLNIL